MNVLHLNEHLDYRGGIETYLLGLIPRLEAEGLHTVVGFAGGDGTLVPRSVQIPSLAVAGLARDAGARTEMRQILDRERPDVIHLHNIQNVDVVEECLDAAPVLFTAHDYRYLCPASTFYFRRSRAICERSCGPGCFAAAVTQRCLTPRPRHAWAYYRRVRRIARNARRFQGVIAPSRSAADRLHTGGFTQEQIRVLPYFCPIAIRQVPRDLPQGPHILFVGRVSENKGWQYFVRALGALPAGVVGTMVGNLNAESRAAVEQLATECRCLDRLTLRPWASRDEIRGVMESASILIFPSIWAETLGIVGLEALASGVPVVASDVGGVREWLLPGRTGLLVPPKDSNAIAGAVRQLLDNPATMLEMGRNGLALIEERFTPERHVQSLIELYAAAAGQACAGKQVPAPVAN